jgi:predicted Zn-dependent protease
MSDMNSTNDMDFMARVRDQFNAVTDRVLGQLREGEQATLNLTAEDTLYLRFNSNRVRQNTDVQQQSLSLSLQSNGRTVQQSRNLCGRFDVDGPAMDALLQACRAEVAVLDLDPNQAAVIDNGSSDEEFRGLLLGPDELVQAVVQAAQGCDLAGLYAGGVVIRANRNSAGQSHWFATETFFLDYSLYDGPRAAKGCYAGARWDDAQWHANLQRTRDLLALLQRPKVDVKPGQYRSYFAPRAFSDLLGIMGWNALSASAWKQGRCPFKRLAEQHAQLSPLLSLGENFALGLSPRFNALGEVSAISLPLVEQGQLRTLLVSSRSAKEYGLVANAAAEGEGPRSLDVAPGTLAEADILQALGTGLYLSNLHYLNWSDPVSARVTGMTRYACFWVEKGEIVGPINDLRWDESLFDALGPKLLALTDWCEVDPAVDTYSARALGGSRVPGALIEGFSFTL